MIVEWSCTEEWNGKVENLLWIVCCKFQISLSYITLYTMIPRCSTTLSSCWGKGVLWPLTLPILELLIHLICIFISNLLSSWSCARLQLLQLVHDSSEPCLHNTLWLTHGKCEAAWRPCLQSSNFSKMLKFNPTMFLATLSNKYNGKPMFKDLKCQSWNFQS